jgi:hypothetical protein
MNITRTTDSHLTAEVLERVAGNPDAVSEPDRRHFESCAQCAAGVEDVRHASVVLRGLSVMEPRPGFVDRVMARVRLPLPWHRRVVVAARERKLATVGLAGGLAAVGAGAAVWAVRFPDLRPQALASWMVGQAGDVFWQLTQGLGRVAYSLGLTDLAGAIAADLSLTSALAALATIALMSMGSFSVMVRLVRETGPRTVRAR